MSTNTFIFLFAGAAMMSTSFAFELIRERWHRLAKRWRSLIELAPHNTNYYLYESQQCERQARMCRYFTFFSIGLGLASIAYGVFS